jgi:hypothetical protein
MEFEIYEYRSDVERRLARLSGVGRLVFALWCCFELRRQFADSLPVCIGSEEANDLTRLIDALWKYVTGGGPPSTETIAKAKGVYQVIEDPNYEFGAVSDRANAGVIELLGCIQKCLDVFEDESVKAAALCAEFVINWHDYEIAFDFEQRDTFSHPKMRKELEDQHRMLEYLSENHEITENDKNRFRV